MRAAWILWALRQQVLLQLIQFLHVSAVNVVLAPMKDGNKDDLFDVEIVSPVREYLFADGQRGTHRSRVISRRPLERLVDLENSDNKDLEFRPIFQPILERQEFAPDLLLVSTEAAVESAVEATARNENDATVLLEEGLEKTGTLLGALRTIEEDLLSYCFQVREYLHLKSMIEVIVPFIFNAYHREIPVAEGGEERNHAGNTVRRYRVTAQSAPGYSNSVSYSFRTPSGTPLPPHC